MVTGKYAIKAPAGIKLTSEAQINRIKQNIDKMQEFAIVKTS